MSRWLLFFLCGAAFAQQQSVNVGAAPNDGTGDPLRTAYIKLNANESQLYAMFGASGLLRGNGAVPHALSTAAGTDVAAVFGGTCNGTTFLRGDGVCAVSSSSLSNLVWVGVTTPSPSNTFLYGSVTTSGTGVTDSSPRGRLAFNYLQDTSDTIQVTCVSCNQSPTIAYDWSDYTMGANWLGYRIGKLVYYTINNPPAVYIGNPSSEPNAYNPNWVGFQNLVNMASHENGLPGSNGGSNGSVFGMNLNMFANPGSSMDNLSGVWDAEFDISFNGSGSAYKKIGLLVRDSGNRSYLQDNAITVALNTGNNVGDQGTFRLVFNAGNAYAATAAMAGDSRGFGFDRRESGSTIKDTFALAAFDAHNVNLTTGGCYFGSPDLCDTPTGLSVGALNVASGGITQQSANVANINVLTTQYAFTGYISGTTLTLSTFAAGAGIGRGQTVYCAGCTPTQFYVQGPPVTGSGGSGSTYTLSATCTAGCGTVGSPVAMTTGQEAQGPYGLSGGSLLMVDGSGNMLAFPAVLVDSPASGTTATTTNTSMTMFLQGLAVPVGYIAAGACVSGTITVHVPGNSGGDSQMSIVVSGGNVTSGTVTTPGSVTAITVGSAMTVSGSSCDAAGQANIVQYLTWGISHVAMNNNGSGYDCAHPPRVVLGGGHTSSVDTVPNFEAVLGACVAVPVAVSGGLSSIGGTNTLSGGVVALNNSGAGATTNINANTTNAATVNIGSDNGVTNDTTTNISGIINIGTAGTQSVGILTGASTGGLNILTGTASGTANIGNTTSSTIQLKGAVNIAPAQTAGAVSILNGASTQALNIDTNGSGNVNLLSGTGTGTFLVGNASSLSDNESGTQKLNGKLWVSTTQPTITSGLGTSPACTVCLTTKAFKITTGASGAPTATVVLGMPAANADWMCQVVDKTTTTVTGRQTADSATSVTFTMSAAPSLSDVLLFTCDAM